MYHRITAIMMVAVVVAPSSAWSDSFFSGLGDSAWSAWTQIRN